MTYSTDPSRYADGFVGDHAVMADVAERAAVAENAILELSLGEGREAFLIQRRTGDGVDQILLDPDQFAANPRYREGTVKPATIASFVRYVNDHKGAGTTIWLDRDVPQFEAVLDDHQATGGNGEAEEAFAVAGWGEHRAVTVLKRTKDFLAWTTFDGKLMSQFDFADFLEQQAHNISDPAAADLLEVAQTLTGTRNASWKSAQRLADGNIAFRYEEDIQGRAGSAGDLDIPARFLLVVEVFEGTQPVNLQASFRWRLNDGRVTLGYRLISVDAAVRAILDDAVEQVEGEAGIEPLMGKPRPGRSGTQTPGGFTTAIAGNRR